MARTRSVARWRIGVPALIVHAAVATFTLRDLAHRPAALVRGPRWAWQVAVTANTLGAIGYWTFGRTRTPTG